MPPPEKEVVYVDRMVEKPVIQTQVVEKRVEVPVAVPVQAQKVQQTVATQMVVPQTQMQMREIVHEPVNVGSVREVSSQVVATPPQSYVQQRVVQGPPVMTMPMTAQTVQMAAPATSYTTAPTVVMGSQYQTGAQSQAAMTSSYVVGGATPPTPPQASRAFQTGPLTYANVQTTGTAPAAAWQSQMEVVEPMTNTLPGTMTMQNTVPGTQMMTSMGAPQMMTSMGGRPTPPMPPPGVGFSGQLGSAQLRSGNAPTTLMENTVPGSQVPQGSYRG